MPGVLPAGLPHSLQEHIKDTADRNGNANTIERMFRSHANFHSFALDLN